MGRKRPRDRGRGTLEAEEESAGPRGGARAEGDRTAHRRRETNTEEGEDKRKQRREKRTKKRESKETDRGKGFRVNVKGLR